MRWLLIAWILAATFFALVPGIEAASREREADRGVSFTKLRFDPPCNEDGSVGCRNAEFVVIRNDSKEVKDLKGWTVHDLGQDFVYEIPYRTRVKPGEKVFLYSGRGQDLTEANAHGEPRTKYYYHWDRRKPVWDNDRDRATLERRDGSVADRCGYGRAARHLKVC